MKIDPTDHRRHPPWFDWGDTVLVLVADCKADRRRSVLRIFSVALLIPQYKRRGRFDSQIRPHRILRILDFSALCNAPFLFSHSLRVHCHARAKENQGDSDGTTAWHDDACRLYVVSCRKLDTYKSKPAQNARDKSRLSGSIWGHL